MSTRIRKNNILIALFRLAQLVRKEEVDIDAVADHLDECLTSLNEGDQFGTEGQNDPRGDFREARAWSLTRLVQKRASDPSLEHLSTVWCVVGHSESGDDYGPCVFLDEPSKKTLSALAYKWDGNEERDGPGYDGSYVHLRVSQQDINDKNGMRCNLSRTAD